VPAEGAYEDAEALANLFSHLRVPSLVTCQRKGTEASRACSKADNNRQVPSPFMNLRLVEAATTWQATSSRHDVVANVVPLRMGELALS
jgi:hypothetical protein